MNEYDLREILVLIQQKFEQRLNDKTGWERNEVLIAYDYSVCDALLSTLIIGKPAQKED